MTYLILIYWCLVCWVTAGWLTSDGDTMPEDRKFVIATAPIAYLVYPPYLFLRTVARRATSLLSK